MEALDRVAAGLDEPHADPGQGDDQREVGEVLDQAERARITGRRLQDAASGRAGQREAQRGVHAADERAAGRRRRRGRGTGSESEVVRTAWVMTAATAGPGGRPAGPGRPNTKRSHGPSDATLGGARGAAGRRCGAAVAGAAGGPAGARARRRAARRRRARPPAALARIVRHDDEGRSRTRRAWIALLACAGCHWAAGGYGPAVGGRASRSRSAAEVARAGARRPGAAGAGGSGVRPAPRLPRLLQPRPGRRGSSTTSRSGSTASSRPSTTTRSRPTARSGATAALGRAGGRRRPGRRRARGAAGQRAAGRRPARRRLRDAPAGRIDVPRLVPRGGRDRAPAGVAARRSVRAA